ncbi:MAG: DUF5681 domain-containing protein [Dehalococcoidia bacterium]|jgi:hypothetical protein|nr:DUF5681 domain-containing protein [Dehalococcoidia bacterium]
MTAANNQGNNLTPWKPGQSGNPSGRPKGTRDLAGYVLETTDGGKELVDALVCITRGFMPNVAVQEGSRPRSTGLELGTLVTFCSELVYF